MWPCCRMLGHFSIAALLHPPSRPTIEPVTSAEVCGCTPLSILLCQRCGSRDSTSGVLRRVGHINSCDGQEQI